jgi:predicted polyphosphate/ATP-dependent NAD kinase
MSTTAQSQHPAGGHGTASEVAHAQQQMNWPWILGVGLGSILIFAVATVWSTHILNATRAEMQPGGPPPLPKGVDQYEVGIVNQRVFALDQRAAQKRLQQMERLRSYGWVDREAGLAHIPIDEAVRMYLADQSKKGGQPK